VKEYMDAILEADENADIDDWTEVKLMEELNYYFYGSFWPKESLTNDDENVEKDEEVSDNYFFWFLRSWQLYIPDTD
jgi:hypothetical protein